MRILILFVLVLITGCATNPPREAASTPPLLIVVSIDSLHNNDINSVDSPIIESFAKDGVRAKALHPVFPSITFPNHYTIVTGLYPEHHGIVGNDVFNPINSELFTLARPEIFGRSDWYGGEPIWVTAQKQGQRSGAFYWMGSTTEIKGVKPTYFQSYNPKVHYTASDQVKQILSWLDLPSGKQPNLLLLYLGDVDAAAHQFGPGSAEAKTAIKGVDAAINQLLEGLKTRGLASEANVILLSDHGMAPVGKDQVIALDKYIDVTQVNTADKGAYIGIFPKRGVSVGPLLKQLKNAHLHLHIYAKNETPEAFHYRNHPFIAPIVGVADEGWLVLPKASDPDHVQKGMHGYDPDLPKMQAIFAARGPAFPKRFAVGPVQNLDLYELMCSVLKIKPAPNDGSLDRIRSLLK